MADLDTKLDQSAESPGQAGSSDSLRDILAGLSSAQKTTFLADIGAATTAQGTLAASSLQPVVAGAGIAGGGFAKHALIAGGAAGDHAVAGIKTGDELDEVLYFIGAGVAVTDVSDLTAEFTIKAGNGVINNTGHTDTTGGKLMVRWTKLTT